MRTEAELNDSLALVSWRARPRTFVALMGLYESNYVRMKWLAHPPGLTRVSGLVSDLRTLDGTHRSCVAGDCDLLLSVTERTPYTSTVNLTYLFQEDAETVQYPDMRVRIYHDAHLAEAQEWAGTHSQHVLKALRIQAERELDQRWARNVMLNKWLEYCVERGHRFSSATRVVAAR
jgi:uncharacterized protein YqiB (DUF1249 family)